jgi:hypothetical protein
MPTLIITTKIECSPVETEVLASILISEQYAIDTGKTYISIILREISHIKRDYEAS